MPIARVLAYVVEQPNFTARGQEIVLELGLPLVFVDRLEDTPLSPNIVILSGVVGYILYGGG